MEDLSKQSLIEHWDARGGGVLPGSTGTVPDTDHVHGKYRLRFSRGAEDLAAVCRLRFRVFNLELGEGFEESFATGEDRDHFDEHCDHLILEHVDDGVVGTYRMLLPEVAAVTTGFYSATEFELTDLPERVLAGSVEIGRACIERQHRGRRTLSLLWRGVLTYVVWNQKRYLFGCSSLTSQDELEGLRLYRWLASRGLTHDEFLVHPLASHRCEAPAEPVGKDPHIPKLFRRYLTHGARVLGPPAIDRAFKTIDFLTMYDAGRLDPKTLKAIGE